ncbi:MULTISPECIES: transcriptional regulator [Empedobacter]|uniref:transcriptional regulator n=1 Tax=Empedobacter TaxID=59734 RepID=UPI002577BB99|nr:MULTISPECIES: transcriptional regulator [Empedobacter]MBY0065625.1 transcriptional regulator [Empedobacter falsenii]MDM1042815.1 transcriptional regulator [Empedobacter brevis]MDM1136745.1 transcriptional regulator [Empedobacter sp. R750]
MDSSNRRICKFIYNNWITKSESQRKFADEHNIEESVVRKIKKASQDDNYIEYNMPISTLERICEAREIKLYEFFKLVNI